MKKLLWLLLAFLFNSPAFATVYTVTANNLQMEVGQTPPWITWTLSTPYTSALFTGEPTCTTTATSASAAGSYTTHCVLGNMATVSGGDSLTFVDGTMNVIPADGMGFQGNASGVTVPSGYFDGTAFGAINVTSNVIANMTANSFSASDATVCNNGTLSDEAFQQLTSWARSEQVISAAVTSGNTVTYTSGGYGTTGFAGLNVGDPFQVGAVLTTISAIAGNVITTTATGLTNATGVRVFPPQPTVSTNGTTTVTITDGTGAVGRTGNVYIGGYPYTIASITDATHIVMTAAVPTSTGKHMYMGSNIATGNGRQTLSLYFPHGCYLLQNPWIMFGNYLTMQGTGSQDSFFRLKTASPAFATGSQIGWFNYAVLAGNASQFNEFIFDMGFQIGAGNPAVEAIKWVNNNTGAMRNVQFYVDDSVAYDVIGLGHSESGPTLLKNVAVYGGNYGFFFAQDRYMITIDQATQEAQQTMGMYGTAGGNHPAVQHLRSFEPVQAISIPSNNTFSLRESELFYSGGSTVPGITVASTGNIHYKNLTSTGYSPAIADSSTGTLVNVTTPASEGWSGTAQTLFDSASTPAGLGLAFPETPVATVAPSTWIELGQDMYTWCSTITGTSGTHLYFYAPPGIYQSSVTGSTALNCSIPDNVDYINLGYGQVIANQAPNSTAQPTPVNWTMAGSAVTPLIIVGPLYQSFYFNHTGPRTLVLEDGTATILPSSGAGDEYIEDFGFGSQTTLLGVSLAESQTDGPTWYGTQHIYGRQVDDENGIQTDNTSAVKWRCSGCTIVFLGDKSEQNSPMGVLTNGAKVEIWGSFFYAVHGCQTTVTGSSCSVGQAMAGSTTAGSNVFTLTTASSVYLNSVSGYQNINTTDSNLPAGTVITAYNLGAGTITLSNNATATETYTTGGTNKIYFQLGVEPSTTMWSITNSSFAWDGFGLWSAGATGPGNLITETRTATTSSLPSTTRIADNTMNFFYSFGAGSTASLFPHVKMGAHTWGGQHVVQ